MVTIGALLACIENFQHDFKGFVLTWANNFSQSIQNLYFSKKLEHISAFEINFYFAVVGLSWSLVYNICVTENAV